MYSLKEQTNHLPFPVNLPSLGMKVEPPKHIGWSWEKNKESRMGGNRTPGSETQDRGQHLGVSMTCMYDYHALVYGISTACMHGDCHPLLPGTSFLPSLDARLSRSKS